MRKNRLYCTPVSSPCSVLKGDSSSVRRDPALYFLLEKNCPGRILATTPLSLSLILDASLSLILDAFLPLIRFWEMKRTCLMC
ncbi:hypothetical protein AAC387_Pa05g2903 [Persea americana]